MSTDEAARLIGCHPRHVRTLISRGKLAATLRPAINQQGQQYRMAYDVSLEEVRRFLDNPQRQGWPRGKPRNQ